MKMSLNLHEHFLCQTSADPWTQSTQSTEPKSVNACLLNLLYFQVHQPVHLKWRKKASNILSQVYRKAVCAEYEETIAE